ncbi:MAG: chromosome segregation protein [bacterium]|jgi:chromosome segregation protein
MRLLRLELAGFKSFCDKSALSFTQNGISIVVGPNGCGKSNIVDAIRWALGEQSAKHLRGAAMEDVIFNGSTQREPVGLAQVTLIFSNEAHNTITKYSEFSEISITRKLFRSGESVYLINNTPCRLMDIRELFMDTGIGGKGYSIIEQGRIGQIVTAKPEDRRTIIDEAAGIVKFKTKRQEAERKLAQTRQNLLRVEDILRELKAQEEVLGTQVEQATIYLETKAQIEHLQKCLEAKKWFQLKQKFEEITKKRDSLLKGQEGGQQQSVLLETQDETIKLDIIREEALLEKTREHVQNHKDQLNQLEAKQKLEQQALENAQEWKEKSGENINRLQQKVQSLEKEILENSSEFEELQGEITEKEEQVEDLSEVKRVNESQLAQRIEEQEKARENQLKILTSLTNSSNHLHQVREKIHDLQEHKIQFESQLKEQLEQKQALEQKSSVQVQSVEGLEERKQYCAQKRLNLEETLEDFNEQNQSLQALLQKKQEELTHVRSRYHSLKELEAHHEEFNESIQTLFEHFQNHPDQAKELGFVGSFMDLFHLPKDLPEHAFTLFDYLFEVIVFQSRKQFSAIRDLLKELNCGQTQILFLDTIPSPHQNNDHTGEDFYWLQEHLKEESKFFLLNNFLKVPNKISSLSDEQFFTNLTLIDDEATIVTKDKIFLLGNGKNQQMGKSHLLVKRKQELEELEEKQDRFEDTIEELKNDFEDQKEQIQEYQKNLEHTKEEQIEINLEIVQKKKDVESFDQLKNQIQTQILQIESKQKTQNQEIVESKQKEINLKGQYQKEQTEQNAIEETLENIQKKIENFRFQMSDEQEEYQHKLMMLTGLKNAFQNMEREQKRLKEEQSKSQYALKKIEDEGKSYHQKIQSIEKTIFQIQSQTPDQLKLWEEFEEKAKKQQNQLEVLKKQQVDYEKQLKGVHKNIEALQKENHELEIQLAQLGEQAHLIEEHLQEENAVTPQEILKTFAVHEFEIKKEQSRLSQLKSKFAKMTNINLAAKEEYDQLVERLNSLQTQFDDLNTSIEALEESILKINKESRRRFRETFHLVNKHFQTLFPEFFGGGTAYLKLTDESNLLESGIEIIAQPPGKKLQNLTLLSGGEKAMTAISLIFAIFLIKPSPFCLLDEVDAPLDDANVGRFNKIVKKMTDNSQFIIITHNKKTMEIGDSLFGITMEEAGVSKVVSVNIQSTNNIITQ